MLEIIAIIYLTRKIGLLAETKGLKPARWKFYMVLGWILFEFAGIIAGVLIFGKDNLVSIILLAYAFAITAYFILRAHLSKLPDTVWGDDIDEIGNPE
jgi:hypothetical protein